MTRTEAIETIYEVINSGIIDSTLEDELVDICNCIEEDAFEDEEDEWEEDEEF